MRQRRWIDRLKNYDCKILYHQGKGNVVTNALSRNKVAMLATILTSCLKLLEVVQELWLSYHGEGVYFAQILAQPTIIQRIQKAQSMDPDVQKQKEKLNPVVQSDFRISDNDIIAFQEQLCVPNDSELRLDILKEAHATKLAIHPRSTKMYQDLKHHFQYQVLSVTLLTLSPDVLHANSLR